MRTATILALLTASALHGEDRPWTSLFNGRDLEGWSVAIEKTPVGTDPKGHIVVRDGVIHMYADTPEDQPDTEAIQQAIDAAHEKGGGIVHLRPGTYHSGTIHLRSRVTLHLEVGATLLGSPRIADYRRGHWPALILARDAENIAITGHGTIDGQGALVAADTIRLWEAGDFLAFYPGMKPGDTLNAWNIQNDASKIDPFELHRQGKLRDRIANPNRKDMRTWRVNENVRPQLIEFSRCRGSRVTDVTLRNLTIGDGGSPAPVIALAGVDSPSLHNISWPASATEKLRELPAP